MAFCTDVERSAPSFTIHHFPSVIDTFFPTASFGLAAFTTMGPVASGFSRVVVEHVPFAFCDSSRATCVESVDSEQQQLMIIPPTLPGTDSTNQSHTAQPQLDSLDNQTSNYEQNQQEQMTIETKSSGNGVRFYRRNSEKRSRSDSDSGTEVVLSPVKKAKRPSIFVRGKEMQTFFGMLCEY